MLQNDGIIIYLQIKTNSYQRYKLQNNSWPNVLSGCTFHHTNQITNYSKTLFHSTPLNVNLVKYGPKNVYKNKVIYKRSYLVLRTLSDGDIKQHGLFSNTPECVAPFQGAGVAGSTVM